MSSDANGAAPVLPADVAVSVQDASKTFQLGELVSLAITVYWLRRRLTGQKRPDNKLDALKHVSFDVPKGEAFAILGLNGSGKSTIAKIISGITLPTDGQVLVGGRVLPLFNVGTGFHSQLTGWENVYQFGAILGLSRAEIREHLPRILEFAEIDAGHMATPLKRFSPGLGARLSFATALCLPADVYLFDEVLNVADDAYKARCVAEIGRLLDRGASVIFISHELVLVQAICSRGVWLHQGRVHMAASMEELGAAYHAFTEDQAASEHVV